MPSDFVPIDLRCNHLVAPLAIREGHPAFSWSTVPDAPVLQRAYQVVVEADTHPPGPNPVPVWDSGKRNGSSSVDVAYEGAPLEPRGRYRWRVRIWGDADAPSAWSDAARFEVGMGSTTSWTASWISWDEHAVPFDPPTDVGPVDPVALGLQPAPYLRRAFDVRGELACARLYVTARGLYEARLNGERVGDAVLAPGWTDYARRLQYQAYDVTGLLTQGANAIGVLLGDGWYSGYYGSHPKRSGAHYGDHPELLAQLGLRYADGTEEWIVTDRSWTAQWGALLHADPLMGELQAPGLDPVGWDRAGFDDRAWHPVVTRGRDDTPLVADPGPPVRVTQSLAPRALVPMEDGTVIVDFGQNLTGWLRLIVNGDGGATIRMRHAEMLDADGRLYVDNLRTARQTDEFWTSGGREMFEPHFTWHGFRYVEVAGYPGALDPACISAQVVHSDLASAGTFECSDPVVNRLHANIDWGLRGNVVSIPTDCPQRDERLGWLGDAQIIARTATYLRDMLAFYDKWLDDVTDAQMASGAFSDVAPRLGLEWYGAPAWGDAGVIVPWTLYKMYGTLRPAARCYDAMSRWMAFIGAGNPDHLRTRELGNNYGDWLAPGADETPRELLATAYWAYDASLMGALARALGRDADAAHYQQVTRAVTAAFVAAFVDADGRVASGTQTAYALALSMHLLPPAQRARSADHLVEAVRARDWHLTTGFVGAASLLPALSENGHADVAHRLLNQDTFPSWRYPVGLGATTVWERWDGWTPERGFQSPHMNSFNHPALGSVGEWLYRFVAGIDQPPDSAGFARARVRPHPGATLRWAGATYRSARGPIVSNWRRHDDTLTLDVRIPANVTASIHVPSADPAGVRNAAGEGPHAIGTFAGDRGVEEAVFEVGPGQHRLVGEYADPVPAGGGV